MKKATSLFIILILFIISTVSASAIPMATLDTQSIETGILSVLYQAPQTNTTKIMIENGSNRVFYNLPSDRTEERFALLMGNGNYKISILEHVKGNQYRPVQTETLQVNIKDSSTLYLSSVQEIRWNEEMAAIQKAAELTEGMTTDLEKVTAVYEYMVMNISYDYDKIPTLTSSYLPDVDSIFLSNKGICYDYASLFAAMLRSVGVQAKMAKGYAARLEEYHAWNEVMVDGEWRTIDTTIDAAYRQASQSIDMFKNNAEFSKTGEA
ncbi:MAG: transglutaminase-like domain-containing protein [Bacillota bacterium]|nr:transglutaminase-like domain-containing protein [Bacillota bacterium]MDW7677628.1 transglutaminase-like domain-containing protein [Bacillota bacterium]